jgi:Holliday junction resolvase RusA-like endonuclease
MDKITVVIEGDPQALQRPRFFRSKNRPMIYDSQARVKSSVSKKMMLHKTEMIKEACHVEITFYFSTSSPLKLWNIDVPTKKDLDNLVKFYLDCGNKILWKDDRLITSLKCKKIFAKEPLTKIEITPMMSFRKSHLKVYETFSPDQLELFKNDFTSYISNVYPNNLEKLNESEKHWQMDQLALGLIKFCDKWSDKVKKVKSIKIDVKADETKI